MEPLIKQPTHALGANADPMPHDEATPSCALCAAEHTGVTTPCYILLRGHYAYIPALDGAIFVLDPRAEVTFMEMPSGRKALAVNTSPQNIGGHHVPAAKVVHEDCLDAVVARLRALNDTEADEFRECFGDDEEEREYPEDEQYALREEDPHF